MLEELAPFVDVPKLNDLKARLESKRLNQAAPAEFELGVIWALSTMGELEVEPQWYGTSRPDVYTEMLFEGRPCAVEITAISDARLAQEDDMRRVANRLCEVANKFRKGSGTHLYFQFLETMQSQGKSRVRLRLVEKNFTPTDETAERLRTWLAQQGDKQPLTIQQGKTHVAVTWQSIGQHSEFNFFSSMPAEAYSLIENPLYEALKKKEKQLVNPDFSGLRCILVADAGSRMLRDQDSGLRSHGTYSARQVIDYFLRQTTNAFLKATILATKMAS
jgi:hypothetical protein